MSKKREYLLIPGAIVHAYNRGVDRGTLFHRPRDYELFLRLLMESQQLFLVTILAYTLMPNHFHLVLFQHDPHAIAAFMERASGRYATIMNKRLKRSGPMFDGPYKGKQIEDAASLLLVTDYIHANPVTAGLTTEAGKWDYSSHRAYVCCEEANLANPALILALVGGKDEYVRFVESFDPADPLSAENFLCHDSAEVWRNRNTLVRWKGKRLTDPAATTE